MIYDFFEILLVKQKYATSATRESFQLGKWKIGSCGGEGLVIPEFGGRGSAYKEFCT